MAKLSAYENRIIWRAEKELPTGTVQYAMRSDYVLLRKEQGNGWKVEERKVFNMAAKRQHFVSVGYKILMGDGSEQKSFAPITQESIITIDAKLIDKQVSEALNNKERDLKMYTAESLKAMTTPGLVALYNELTGKKIKRFATRAKGEAQVLKAATAKPAAAAKSVAKPEVKKAPAVKPRKVKGTAGAQGSGRPKESFVVKLTKEKAKSKPNKESLRTQLIDFLEGQSGNSATIETIEAHFDRNMRGVVGKLIEKKLCERV